MTLPWKRGMPLREWSLPVDRVLPGVALLLSLLSGCHTSLRRDELRTSREREVCAATPLNDVACEYVNVALALGERDPDSLDFSIASPAEAAEAHAKYARLDQIASRARHLLSRLQQIKASTAEEQGRANVLALQLAAVETRVEMLHGRTYPFDVEVTRLFNTQRQPDTQVLARKAVRGQIAKWLSAQKPALKGSLAVQYATYDRRFLVPADRLEKVMHASLAVCREQTAKSVPLPADEAVQLTFVRHQPWSAFSRYRGHGHSIISVNLDFPLTVDQALELACHEGYPGHHVFNTERESALVAQRHWPEAEVQLTFSPQSYVSEAAAAFAPQMALTLEDRLRIEHDLLFPLAGLPATEAERYVRISALVRELDSAQPAIARDYLDGTLEFVRAQEALADELLMAHAEASLLYLNEYRSYVLAYTDGRRRVGALVDAGHTCAYHDACSEADERGRWAAYKDLMRTFQVSLPPLRR